MAIVNSFFRPQVDLGLSAVKSQFSFSNMCNCEVTELQKPHQKTSDWREESAIFPEEKL